MDLQHNPCRLGVVQLLVAKSWCAATLVSKAKAYHGQLEVHELGTVIRVNEHPLGRELLILSWDLGEMQILHAHGHIFHDCHHHFVIQLNCFIVDQVAQGTPLWTDHHLRTHHAQLLYLCLTMPL